MGLLKKTLLLVAVAITVNYIREWMRPKVPTTVHGHCQPRFEGVKEAFRHNLESGLERGGAFAVFHEGKLVCDLWGGFADESIEYPWQENTLSVFYSVTKSISATCLMILADRGLIDYNKPVAQYWPEFAQNGKGTITVQQLVSHQAGLAAIDEDYSIRLVKDDPDKIGRILAAQTPNWPPGSMSGYHGLTYGLYIDQLIRRVDKKKRGIQRFFDEEIAQPFDIDIYIGLPKHLHYRAARFMEFEWWESMLYGMTVESTRRMMIAMLVNKDALITRALHVEDTKISRKFAYWPEYKEVPHGSIYGYGTARAMAKFYGILANGGEHENKTMLSAAVLPRVDTGIIQGQDRILLQNITWGSGMVVVQSAVGTTVFGHPGYGGQMGFGDRTRRLGWSYLTNYPSMTLDEKEPRYARLKKAMCKAVKKTTDSCD